MFILWIWFFDKRKTEMATFLLIIVSNVEQAEKLSDEGSVRFSSDSFFIYRRKVEKLKTEIIEQIDGRWLFL